LSGMAMQRAVRKGAGFRVHGSTVRGGQGDVETEPEGRALE
jgi:hypothetical protein